MAKQRKAFTIEILTPAGPVFKAEVIGAVLPAADGQIGILGGRAPLAATVGAGMLTTDLKDGGRREFLVEGGFAQMSGDLLTVLAESCEAIEQVDPEAAWEELQKARRMPAETDGEYAARDRAVTAARTKFRLVQEYRKQFVTPDEGDADSIADADLD